MPLKFKGTKQNIHIIWDCSFIFAETQHSTIFHIASDRIPLPDGLVQQQEDPAHQSGYDLLQSHADGQTERAPGDCGGRCPIKVTTPSEAA